MSGPPDSAATDPVAAETAVVAAPPLAAATPSHAPAAPSHAAAAPSHAAAAPPPAAAVPPPAAATPLHSPDGRPPARPEAAGGPAHLGAVDVVRVVTVGGVIAVHCTSLTAAVSSSAAGGVLDVLHVTRSVFLFLSAFVLGYSLLRRPLAARAFWRRRYPLVVAPYVVWSAIYVLTGGHRGGPLRVAATFAVDLFDGGAHFHLYFLLLTFQLYAVYPALIGFFRRHPGAAVPALAGSAAFELAFTAAIHYGWRPPILGMWLRHPGSWLPSYALYVVGGVLAAFHFERVTSWVRSHVRLVLLSFVASLGLCVASYLSDLTLGYRPIRASQVFQPTNVVEAVTATLALYALGLVLVERLGPSRLAFLRRGSDVSFGVYLAHPLLLAGLLDAAGWIGLAGVVGRLPGGAVEALAVLGMAPFAYGVCFAGVDLARRTPLSLYLTGRRGRRPGATGRGSRA